MPEPKRNPFDVIDDKIVAVNDECFDTDFDDEPMGDDLEAINESACCGNLYGGGL